MVSALSAGVSLGCLLSAWMAVRFRLHSLMTAGFPLGALIGDLTTGQWPGAGIAGACLLVILGRGWWNKRGGKAARELGAKSRARVEALVGALRDLGQPVPEGAR